MKKFAFSLEKVLSFKQQTLDIKKNELAMLQVKLMDLESKPRVERVVCTSPRRA